MVGQLKLLTPSPMEGIAHNHVISRALFCITKHVFSVLVSALQIT